ncbi:MAG TPA: tRNA pseudouridine(38-40) synthase TruA [Vicinamibacterales bacterium]|nr:tRNA pseudouridine(38-40) synthase TruA [Vicinamibacterales bacterium]
MRFRLTIEYAGTRYSGWQIQKNARTVQGELQRAIGAATGARDFELYGSGRTDAGVHALAQVAHLDLTTSLPPDALMRCVNDELPSDINILRIQKVRHTFHARHSARSRSYVYQVARRRTAFVKPLVWWVKDDLNVATMRAVAKRLVGFHDFRSFSDDDPEQKSTTVSLTSLEIHEAGDILLFRVEGSHFIWKMVRRLVGVIVEVGRGGLTADEAVAMLSSESELPARLTAPASGLFLERVRYDGDPPESEDSYGLLLAGGVMPLKRK